LMTYKFQTPHGQVYAFSMNWHYTWKINYTICWKMSHFTTFFGNLLANKLQVASVFSTSSRCHKYQDCVAPVLTPTKYIS
jgi:hypothetical protein